MHDSNDDNNAPETPGRENIPPESSTPQTTTPTTWSPLRAIRAKCLDCCLGSKDEVRLCPATDCPLYPYRMGKNPRRKSTMTPEQRKAAAERIKAINAARWK